jgi:hypothetical protein
MDFGKKLLKVMTWKSEDGIWIEGYDILQVCRDGEWGDFATIRDINDATLAVNYLKGRGNPPGGWESIEGFRIVGNRNYRPYTIILETKDLV